MVDEHECVDAGCHGKGKGVGLEFVHDLGAAHVEQGDLRLVSEVKDKREKLAANLHALLDQLMKLKPATAKGTYMKSVTISTTHGPGVKIDTTPYTVGAGE